MALQRPSRASLPSVTSANGTARYGTAIMSDDYQAGTLVFDCAATIVTGSVVATFRVQGSVDGTTWVNLVDLPNTAPTTLAATGTIAILVPMAAYAFQQVRVSATLSGAATASGDVTSVTARYIPRGKLWG